MAIVNITTQNDADFCRPFVLQTTDGTPDRHDRRVARDDAAAARGG